MSISRNIKQLNTLNTPSGSETGFRKAKYRRKSEIFLG